MHEIVYGAQVPFVPFRCDQTGPASCKFIRGAGPESLTFLLVRLTKGSRGDWSQKDRFPCHVRRACLSGKRANPGCSASRLSCRGRKLPWTVDGQARNNRFITCNKADNWTFGPDRHMSGKRVFQNLGDYCRGPPFPQRCDHDVGSAGGRWFFGGSVLRSRFNCPTLARHAFAGIHANYCGVLGAGCSLCE